MSEETKKNNVFNFDFESGGQVDKVVTLAGKDYTIPFDDEAYKRYQLSLVKFRENYKETERLSKGLDFDTCGEKEISDLFDIQHALVKDFVSVFVGEEGYTELYEKSGRSNIRMMGVCHFLAKLISGEAETVVEEARSKYLSNAKQ
ncbi:hypothetical protein [Lysinibacillus sp. RS5]|uniref:hypothetical protein n=1 Tax=unclassified Lysinibacillus TaxID=2636778 RepID=UPI0035BE3A33